MRGRDLKQMAEAAGLSPMQVLHESGIESPKTLYKVYNDQPVRPTTRAKIERAIRRLAAKATVPEAG